MKFYLAYMRIEECVLYNPYTYEFAIWTFLLYFGESICFQKSYLIFSSLVNLTFLNLECDGALSLSLWVFLFLFLFAYRTSACIVDVTIIFFVCQCVSPIFARCCVHEVQMFTPYEKKKSTTLYSRYSAIRL